MKVPKLLRNAALFASLIAAAVPSLSVPANAAWRGGWGGWHGGWGGWRGGWGWGGVSLGLAAGALAGTALTAPYYGYGYGPYYGYSYGYPAYGYSYVTQPTDIATATQPMDMATAMAPATVMDISRDRGRRTLAARLGTA